MKKSQVIGIVLIAMPLHLNSLLKKEHKMSFWKKTLKVANDVGLTVVNAIEEKANEVREITQKYEDMSDNELFDVIKSDGFWGKSKQEKGIAFSILRRRGYSQEEINEKSL